MLLLLALFAGPLRADRIVRTESLELSVSDDAGRSTRILNSATGAAWLEKATPLFLVAGHAGLTSRLAVDTAGDGEIRLGLEVTNTSAETVRATVSFPILHGLGIGGSSRVGYCFPRSGAVIDRVPVELRSRYGGLFPLQFLAVFHPRAGALYVRTEDLELHEKTYWLTKTADGRVDLGVDYAPRTLRSKETWKLPAAVLGADRGDWHVAFDAYRRWAQEWHRPAVPRKRWFREVFSFRQVFLHPNLGLSHGAFDPSTRRFRLAEMVREDVAAFGGVDFVHIFDWSKTLAQGRVGAYDPWDYLGGSAGLRSEIDVIRDMGLSVGVYLEGYLVSKPAAIAKRRGDSWQLLREDGKPHTRFGSEYYYMCPHVGPWREYLARALSDAASTLDVQGVYIDELGFGYQYPCYREDHGHGVPSSQLAGEHALLSACRSTLPAEKVLYTEETPADVSTQLVDGSFTYALSRRQGAGKPGPLNLTRFALPHFKTFEILHVDRPMGNDLEGVRRVFFNGEGIWLAGASSKESWFPLSTRRLIARTHRILRTHRGAFCSAHPEPDVPTLKRELHANRFPGRSEVLWTLLNTGDDVCRGEVLRVEHFDGARYWDVWNDREIVPRIDGDHAYVTQEIPAGEVACIRRADERGVEKIEALGGIVFRRSGRIVEVKLNRSRISDDDLELLAGFAGITDLSLEETPVGDAGLAQLADLHELEWLNLYRTQVGDATLANLKPLQSLRHLPIGETRVTDAGLEHLKDRVQLLYLGLRGNAITDAGLIHLQKLVHLEGLHLGQTRVTDRGLGHLRTLERLKKLWLHDTAITDASVSALLELSTLKELHVYRTQLTAEAFRKLRQGLPACRVVSEPP